MCIRDRPVAALVAAGGLGPVTEGLRAIDPDLLSLTGGELGVAGVFGLISFLTIGAGFLGSPQIFARSLALRSEREVRRGAAVAIVWTVLADTGAVLSGLFGRYLLSGPGDDLVAVLGVGGEDVLPLLVEQVFPLVVVGMYVAVVLAAIMSTIDSLLVVASSAVVRDWYQKVRHPELPDGALTGLARWVTFGLATVALLVALAVAWVTPERTVFWFVIFGWSGIAATFCPTIILSLFWRGMTARGALAAMLAGFVSVPVFKFAVPALPGIGPVVAELRELTPAFLVSLGVGWLVSRSRPHANERAREVDDELRWAARRGD